MIQRVVSKCTLLFGFKVVKFYFMNSYLVVGFLTDLRYFFSMFFIILCMLLSSFMNLRSASRMDFIITDLRSFYLSSSLIAVVVMLFITLCPKMPFLVNICLSFYRYRFYRKYQIFKSPSFTLSLFLSHTSQADVLPLLMLSTKNLTSFMLLL